MDLVRFSVTEKGGLKSLAIFITFSTFYQNYSGIYMKNMNTIQKICLIKKIQLEDDSGN